MANLSLRKLDDETAARLKAEARHHDMSVNTFLLRLIHQQLDGAAPSSPPRLYHDLDHLAGTWSAEEADALHQTWSDFDTIDLKLWP